MLTGERVHGTKRSRVIKFTECDSSTLHSFASVHGALLSGEREAQRVLNLLELEDQAAETG